MIEEEVEGYTSHSQEIKERKKGKNLLTVDWCNLLLIPGNNGTGNNGNIRGYSWNLTVFYFSPFTWTCGYLVDM